MLYVNLVLNYTDMNRIPRAKNDVLISECLQGLLHSQSPRLRWRHSRLFSHWGRAFQKNIALWFQWGNQTTPPTYQRRCCEAPEKLGRAVLRGNSLALRAHGRCFLWRAKNLSPALSSLRWRNLPLEFWRLFGCPCSCISFVGCIYQMNQNDIYRIV